MRGVWTSALAGLLLMAAGAVHGADAPAATLDATKQELRQLQDDQKNKAGQPGEKIRLTTPGVGLQLQEDPGSPEAWLSEKLKKERKLKEQKDSNKNWLVDGVEKLEKSDAQAKEGAVFPGKNQANDTSPQTIDQSDPQYLLKLFDEQKKTSDNKTTATKSVPAPDPFAPFLQSWLGSSPSRGQFFDQFARRSESGGSADGSPPVSADYRSSVAASTSAAPLAGPDAVVPEKTNPYLLELNTPILSREIVNDANQLSSLGSPTMVPTTAQSGPVVIPTSPAADTRERAKVPPSTLTDDKKYFPQLKRF